MKQVAGHMFPGKELQPACFILFIHGRVGIVSLIHDRPVAV